MESGVGMLRDYSGEDKVGASPRRSIRQSYDCGPQRATFSLERTDCEAMTSRPYISSRWSLYLVVLRRFSWTVRPRVATSASKDF